MKFGVDTVFPSSTFSISRLTDDLSRTPVCMSPRLALCVLQGGRAGARRGNSSLKLRISPHRRRRNEPVRKKIIGHGTGCLRPRSGYGGRVRFDGGEGLLVTMFEQPARKHGRGVLLNPQVHKRGDLLTKIRRVAEARELEGLQAVARSGQQKIPRRLDTMLWHSGSPKMLQEYLSNRV